ncbi:MAG: hypothetical protein WC799_15720 [Desulfobacteraceae bacterium]|jgi:hypothetical protein
MSGPKVSLKKVWGVLLFAAGIGMLFTIPERVLEFQAQGRYFYGMKPALYLISVLLVVGGGKKIFDKSKINAASDDETGR